MARYLSLEPLSPKRIAQASAGDREAALEVIGQFAVAVKLNLKLRPDVCEYLADAFSQILHGTEPARALNLSKRRGRPSSAKQRQDAIVVHVHLLRAQGDKREDAFRKTAKKYSVAHSTVETYYKKHSRPALKYKAALLNALGT